ncbi:MAG: putative LPS assembly protein LptD, partial [Marinirhabdus sp.]
TLTGDYYTNGSYGLRAESAYALRYRFRGNVSLRYENLIQSERGFPNFSQSEVYNIRWNHGQDAKANPSSRFSASVNLGSSRYFQQSINQINNASGLVNTLSSSVSYSKTLPTEPEINYTVAATHSQNTNTQQITMSLPNVNGNVSRVFPFAPKVGAKKGVVDNINLQYSVQAQNRVITTDSLFFKPEMFDNLVWGARHSVPLSTNFKVLGYLSASASANYTETWVGNTTRQRFDPSAGAGAGAVVTDTVRGFDAFRTYSFGSSLGTTVYGTFNFGGAKKIQAIRHVIRPSVSFGVTPGFGQYYEDLVIPSADPEVNDEVRRYSRFERSLFGAPNQN